MAARRHGDAAAATLDQHLQPLPAGGSVLLGPAAPEQATGALTSLGPSLFTELALAPGLVVVDCGRLTPGPVTRLVFRNADLVLLVCRPAVDSIVHAHSRLVAIGADTGDRLGVLLIGDRPYGAAEVEAAIGTRVVGALADDPRGAATLYRAANQAAARRILLVRSARSFLERTVTSLAPEMVNG